MGILSGAEGITPSFIQSVLERIADDKRVRRRLPGGGRLHIDRRLPFLCVYREPGEVITGDTPKLVWSEAAYMIAPGTSELHAPLRELVRGVADIMVEAFGAFLLIELWAARASVESRTPRERSSVRRPTFTVLTSDLQEDDPTVRQFARALSEIPLRPPPLDVAIGVAREIAPPEMPPLLAGSGALSSTRYAIGLELQPVYRQASSGAPYPMLFRTLRRGMSVALKQTAYHFAVTHSTHTPPHYHAMGRRVAVRAAQRVDRELTEISRSFDFLLQVTPVNISGALAAFEADRRERAPVFDYRPLVVDTDLVKRQLYNLPLEELEDPTLAHMLGDARDELDRKVTMLADRNTPRFLYGSLGVYGPVEESLRTMALELLSSISPDRVSASGEQRVGAAEFARRAEREIAFYREQHPEMAAKVHVREDVAGLLVSDGDLLVGGALDLTESRVEALIQHEVGTHVVTHYNGLAQPLGQLATGLAGYEELQEGLAVLAEHLSGALSAARMRTFAGRVLAVHAVASGATFVENHRELTRHGFGRREAFTMCMRAHRSGGLTKDAIYLRGLVQLLEYLRDDGDLVPLYLGKVALSHVPALRELRWREYLRAAPLEPRYLGTPAARERLAGIRRGVTVGELINETTQ